MPHVAKPKHADEMQVFAHTVYKDVTAGPGTTHARLRRLEDLLTALAKENYEAGVADGEKKSKEGQALVAGLPGITPAPVPPPATSP